MLREIRFMVLNRVWVPVRVILPATVTTPEAEALKS